MVTGISRQVWFNTASNYTNFECVVIVDGSTDSSYLKYYRYVESLDSRFSLLSMKPIKALHMQEDLV